MRDVLEGTAKLEKLVLSPEEQKYANARSHQVRTLIQTNVQIRRHLGVEFTETTIGDLVEENQKDDTRERMIDLNRLNELAKHSGGTLSLILRNAAGEELDLASLYLQ